MKLWAKNTQVDKNVETYTVGLDRELDIFLAPYDVLGSMAHVKMLLEIGLVKENEYKQLSKELKSIYEEAVSGNFIIEDGIEDVHSQVELLLTRKLGDIGKKIHSGRSRNDQVLVDLKLFSRSKIISLVQDVSNLIDTLIFQSNKYKDILFPGYTHLQIAMPSSFGLWFAAYAESLVDDLQFLLGAFKVCNRNPLGSAAGYGSSFPLKRQKTTDLLGFDNMNYNVVYAQMGRGKMEKLVSMGISSIAATISKLAYDVCLYTSQNFNFMKLTDEFTTGSSIMPHKKNPDVFELTRAKCNKLQGLPNDLTLIINNLPSGYFRDLQITKEIFVPSFEEIFDIISMVNRMIGEVKINTDIINDDKYLHIFSVEEVNNLVLQGMPFRDAYKKVGLDIEDGKFTHNKKINHTHEGSIGNLCNDKILKLKEEIISNYNISKIEKSISDLLNN